MKRVPIAPPPSAQAWIDQGAAPAAKATPQPDEETKRLTLDLPRSMHTAFKVQCAQEGKTMVEALRAYIESRINGDKP